MESTWMPRVISDGAAELLKWSALLAMLVDHVNAAFFDRHAGLPAEVIGRLAMPVFSIVLAYNLARPGVDLSRALRRLVLVGALAVPAHAYLFGWLGIWPLNVLLTFAVAVGVIMLVEQGRRVEALVFFLLASCLVEYWHAGVGLVVAFWAYFRGRDTRGLWAGLALVGLCLVNVNTWALLALPLVWFSTQAGADVPRLRWAFYVAYPVHLSVIALLRIV
jgi:hypothetical protein